MFDGIALNMPILRSSGHFADVSICFGFFFVSDVGFVVVSEVQVRFTVRVAAVDFPATFWKVWYSWPGLRHSLSTLLPYFFNVPCNLLTFINPKISVIWIVSKVLSKIIAFFNQGFK